MYLLQGLCLQFSVVRPPQCRRLAGFRCSGALMRLWCPHFQDQIEMHAKHTNRNISFLLPKGRPAWKQRSLREFY